MVLTRHLISPFLNPIVIIRKVKKIQDKIENNLLRFKKLVQKKRLRLDRFKQSSAVPSETNFSQKSFECFYEPNTYEYGYQRINLNLKSPGKNHPYFGLGLFSKEKYSCFFAYTNTGQSAISAALMAFRRIYSSKVLVPEQGCYYETFAFLKDFSFSIVTERLKKNPLICLLDSSTQDCLGNTKIANSVRVVVIDTTCLSLAESDLRKRIDRWVSRGIAVCLVRSHIKIDCFGSEYGRLGSLFYIGPQNIKKLKAFRETFNAVAGPLGLRCQLSQVYPFLYGNNFRYLNEKWIHSIRNSNQRFLSELNKRIQNKNIRIMGFDHNLFSWIIFSKITLAEVEKLEKNIIKDLNSHAIPAFKMASYPWDVLTFSSFKMSGQFDKSILGKPALRISSGQLTISQLNAATLIIAGRIAKQYLTAN